MVDDWLDTLCDVFAIDLPDGRRVKTYHVIDPAETPESISVFPCAITYTQAVRSVAGPVGYALWEGQTELHLTPNKDKRQHGFVMSIIRLVEEAIASNLTLGGKVDYFVLRFDRGSSIDGPVTMQYGSEAEHLGLLVHWEVKETASIDVSG